MKKALLKAAESNTYVETVSNKADTLHYHIEKNYEETLMKEYQRFLEKIIKKQRLGVVTLVGDITSENFYGKVEGLHISPWTGENGIKGKFNFLVLGVMFRNKIYPFYVKILRIGSFKAQYLGEAIELCKKMNLKIKTIMLDRGFYSGDIIDTFNFHKINYLIFVPRKELFKSMLASTDKSVSIWHEIPYSKNKSRYRAETQIALVKDVREHDWIFATNISFRDKEKYVWLYMKRWNIETMFRVHDEAKIKTKSKNPVIRLFYFMMSMFLLFLWNLKLKFKIQFKRFIIEIYEIIRKEVDNFRV